VNGPFSLPFSDVIMDTSETPPAPQKITLQAGAQAVINGALVTATQACTLEVGSGAFVLTGRGLWREREALRHPHEELYFSMLEAGSSPERFHDAQRRLFNLLSQVVAQSPSHIAQKECAVCAAALMSGDARAASASAARLVTQSPSERDTCANIHARPSASRLGGSSPRRLRGLP
jgi:flagellar biosynthesis regulator FlbT